MLTKAEIYHWFQDNHAWNRIDFVCNIIRLCNPFELKFIRTCIEDVTQADANVWIDQETKANSLQNLELFIKESPPSDKYQSRIAIGIALLQPRNYQVAAKIGELLEEKFTGLNLQQLQEAHLQNEFELWVLLLTLACYHPAFKLNMQLKFKEKLAEYERMQESESQIYQARHFPQKQRYNWDSFEDGEWSMNLHPNAVPFHQYSGRHLCRYVDYYNKSYHAYIHGRTDNGYTAPTTMRPSHFPANLPSPTGLSEPPMEPSYPPRFMPNFTHPIQIYSNRPTQDYVLSNKVCNSRLQTLDSSMVGDGLPSSSSIPSVYDNAKPVTTVTQPRTFTNVTTVPSTVVPTSVATSVVSCSKSFNQIPCAASSNTPDSANSSSAFITIPSSACHETSSSNKVCYEIKTKQQSKNRNRSQSGDTSANHQRRSQAQTLTHFTAQPLRSSTSAPILASSSNQVTMKPSNTGTGSNSKMSSQSTAKARVRQIPRPSNVFVTSKGKGTSFRFEITWTDGTTSECNYTVQEIIYFYKHALTKLGKNSAAIECLSKQNNQTMDRGQKLENIFSNFINNYVMESNIEDVLRFFKHNMPPPMTQPRKRFRQVSKCRQIVDGSSSSSSTASPPLVNSTKSKILQSVPRINATTSPPPAQSVTSTSSVLSSSSSITSIPTNAEATVESGLNDRNDPYLKLYYWLKGHGLTDAYTHLRRYKFDEFCKLQPADIDSTPSLSTQQKTTLKERMAKLDKESLIRVVDINMGSLSLSSKASSSDTSSDNGKLMDIKSILDDVARQSEEERSGSSQSAPVSFTNCSNPDVAISDTGLSFEFEGTDHEETSVPSTQTDEVPQNLPDVQCIYRNTPVVPTCISIQGDLQAVTDVSSISRYPSSTVPNVGYCSGPYEIHQKVPPNWHQFPYTCAYMPVNSYKVIPAGPNQSSSGNIDARTIPSPVYPQSSKPMQYAYASTGLESRQSFESNAALPPHLQSTIPQQHSAGVSQPPQNLYTDYGSSTTFSKLDSVYKQHNKGSTMLNSSATAYPSHSYYASAQRYGTRHPPPSIGQNMHPLSPSYSDPTIYPSQTQLNFKRSEHKQSNLTSSVSAHTMNGYPENKPAFNRMHQGSHRGRGHYKRHNYGDGPKKVLHCCNCGKKGHVSTTCRELDIADTPKSVAPQEISTSRMLKSNK